MASKKSVIFSMTLPILINTHVLKEAKILGMTRSAYMRHLATKDMEDKSNTENR